MAESRLQFHCAPRDGINLQIGLMILVCGMKELQKTSTESA